MMKCSAPPRPCDDDDPSWYTPRTHSAVAARVSLWRLHWCSFGCSSLRKASVWRISLLITTLKWHWRVRFACSFSTVGPAPARDARCAELCDIKFCVGGGLDVRGATEENRLLFRWPFLSHGIVLISVHFPTNRQLCKQSLMPYNAAPAVRWLTLRHVLHRVQREWALKCSSSSRATWRAAFSGCKARRKTPS